MMTQPSTTSKITNWSNYTIRLVLLSFGLAFATAAAIFFAPRLPDITIIESTSFGSNIARDKPIRIVFSRPVDKRSAERAFVLYPPTPGRFVWVDQHTLEFQLAQPLKPETIYNITIRPGLRDTRGNQNNAETRWSFRTTP